MLSCVHGGQFLFIRFVDNFQEHLNNDVSWPQFIKLSIDMKCTYKKVSNSAVVENWKLCLKKTNRTITLRNLHKLMACGCMIGQLSMWNFWRAQLFCNENLVIRTIVLSTNSENNIFSNLRHSSIEANDLKKTSEQ